MTRKDYVAIAQVLESVEPGKDSGVWLVLRERIADVFAGDNPRFDRERFYIACKVTP